METYLFCLHCKDETPHEVVYINGEIHSVSCKNCSRLEQIKFDPKKEFLKEMYNRIATKPSRITKEYNEDLSTFLLRLPARIVKKPYRLMRDLNEWRKFFKTYKNQ
jgi:hypothetical protein